MATRPVLPPDTPLLDGIPWCYYLGHKVDSWTEAAALLGMLAPLPTRRTILAHAKALEHELGCPPPVGSPFRRAPAGRPKGSRNRPKVVSLPSAGSDVPPEAA